MRDSNSINPTPPPSGEWQPTWTVITTPPSVAERWATRAMASGLEGAVTGLVIWLVFLVGDVVMSWNTGSRVSLIFRGGLFVLLAVSAWDRYAFGQLLERYRAELRTLQAREEARR